MKSLVNEIEQVSTFTPQEKYDAALSAQTEIDEIISSQFVNEEYVLDIRRRVQPLISYLEIRSKNGFSSR